MSPWNKASNALLVCVLVTVVGTTVLYQAFDKPAALTVATIGLILASFAFAFLYWTMVQISQELKSIREDIKKLQAK